MLEIEPANRLYAKHVFRSGEELATGPYSKYLTEEEVKNYLIRGWRCGVCGQTEPECKRRNELRPYPMGTIGPLTEGKDA